MDGSFAKKYETYLKEYVFARNQWLMVDNVINVHFLHRPVVNDVVITDSALLPFLPYRYSSENSIDYYTQIIAGRLSEHAKQVSAYGGYFCYVAVPCQYVSYEDSYPWYLNNLSEYTEKSSKALFSALKEHAIDYIDMREVFGENIKEYSSTIDNHYGINGAYRTYEKIIEKANQNLNNPTVLLNENDFSTTVIPNRYLGSRLRKLLGAKKVRKSFKLWN